MFQAFSARKPTCVLENDPIYFVSSLFWWSLKTIEICNGCCKLYVTLRVFGGYESLKVFCRCWRLRWVSRFAKSRRDSRRKWLRCTRIQQIPRGCCKP